MPSKAALALGLLLVAASFPGRSAARDAGNDALDLHLNERWFKLALADKRTAIQSPPPWTAPFKYRGSSTQSNSFTAYPAPSAACEAGGWGVQAGHFGGFWGSFLPQGDALSQQSCGTVPVLQQSAARPPARRPMLATLLQLLGRPAPAKKKATSLPGAPLRCAARSEEAGANPGQESPGGPCRDASGACEEGAW